MVLLAVGRAWLGLGCSWALPVQDSYRKGRPDWRIEWENSEGGTEG